MAHKARENYVRVINSNIIDEPRSMFLAAGAKPIVGKGSVRAWADDYYKGFKTHWDKPVKEFVISSDTHSSGTTTRPRTRRSVVASLSSFYTASGRKTLRGLPTPPHRWNPAVTRSLVLGGSTFGRHWRRITGRQAASCWYPTLVV